MFVVGEILKSQFLALLRLCDQFFFAFCSHFGEARALPGDAVRPAGNQARNISPITLFLFQDANQVP